MNETAKVYWQKFLDSLPDDSPYRTRRVMAEGWALVRRWRMNWVR